MTGNYSFLTAPYLSNKFAYVEAQENLYVNSTVCPDEALLEAIKNLKSNQKLVKEDTLIAALCDRETLRDFQNDDITRKVRFCLVQLHF